MEKIKGGMMVLCGAILLLWSGYVFFTPISWVASAGLVAVGLFLVLLGLATLEGPNKPRITKRVYPTTEELRLQRKLEKVARREEEEYWKKTCEENGWKY